MRIKINGAINPDRVADAVRSAQAQLPGCTFFGANLYLSLYDKDGEPLESYTDKPQPIAFTVNAPKEGLKRPALTEEAIARRAEAKADADRKKVEAQKRAEERFAEAILQQQQDQKRAEVIRGQWQTVNSLTDKLLDNMPERFVSELNSAVQSTWNDLKPVEPHGKKKGQLKPTPIFNATENGLQIMYEGWKRPRIFSNPTYTMEGNSLTTFWKHSAWVEAVRRMKNVMCDLNFDLMASGGRGHLARSQITRLVPELGKRSSAHAN